jgi:hypothetical protein
MIKKFYAKMKSEMTLLKKREEVFKNDLKDTRNQSRKKYNAARNALNRIQELEKIFEFVTKYGETKEELSSTVEKIMRQFSIGSYTVTESLSSQFDKITNKMNEMKASVKDTFSSSPSLPSPPSPPSTPSLPSPVVGGKTRTVKKTKKVKKAKKVVRRRL